MEVPNMRRKITHVIGTVLFLLGFFASFVLAGGEEMTPLGAIATEVGGIAALFVGSWMTRL